MMSCTSACRGEACGPRSATLAADSSASEGVRWAEGAAAADTRFVRFRSVSAACSASCLHEQLAPGCEIHRHPSRLLHALHCLCKDEPDS